MAEITDLGKKIDDLAVVIEDDTKKVEDDIHNNQKVTQRSGDYADEEDEVVEEVEPEYVKNINKIKNSGKTEREIYEDMVEENEKLITSIDSKIDELNKKIDGDPFNEDVQKWKDDALTLEEIKKQKLTKNNKLKEDIASNGGEYFLKQR